MSQVKPKYFHPNKGLMSLPIFKWTAGIIVVAALLAGGVIAWKTSLEWELTSDGFNEFLVVFRFPIGLLTLLIPILAVYAANHRSEQAKLQIEKTESQNRFANYYKHREEFKTYVEEESYDKHFDSVFKLHKALFGANKDWDGNIVDDVNAWIDDIIEKLMEYFGKLNNASSADEKMLNLCQIQVLVDAFADRFSLISKHDESVEHEAFNFTVLSQYYESPLMEVNHRLTDLTKVCEFDDQFKKTDLWKRLDELDDDDMPKEYWPGSDRPISFDLRYRISDAGRAAAIKERYRRKI